MKDKATATTLSIKPISILKQKYDKGINTRAFKHHFFNRNDRKVITPFLKGIEAEFVSIDNLVFVQYSDSIINKLKDLGFVAIFEFLQKNEIPSKNDREFKELITSSVRLYNHEYNVEIYMMDNSVWPSIVAASVITADLKRTHDETDTFVSVYTSLLKLSK